MIYFGNDGGLYKTSDSGQTIQALNDSLVLEQFYTVSGSATDPSLFFGGLQDNGIQRKLANSATWNWMRSGDGGAIVINPLDPSIVFAVDDYQDTAGAVYRYNNRGQTFAAQIAAATTFGEPTSGGRIAFIPAFTGNHKDSTLYYGTWRLFTSKDLGATWLLPCDVATRRLLPTPVTRVETVASRWVTPKS